MARALFWDFDGTLTEPVSKWTPALYEALHEKCPAVTYDQVREHMRTGYSWHTPERAYTDRVGMHWWLDLFAHFDSLYEALHVPVFDRLYANEYLRAKLIDPASHVLYPDTIATLQACKGKGYDNYILSNNYPELPDTIAGMGLSPFIKGCVVSAGIGYEKPRGEFYACAKELAAPASPRFMIGDNPDADIRGAKEAGIAAIQVHTPLREGHAYAPSHHFETLAEVVAVLP